MRKGHRKQNSDKDLLNLQPSEDYKDPGAPRYPQLRGRTYTGGTYNEKLTGRYFTNRPDMSLSDSRPLSHGKSLARDIPSAKATKGNKAPSAARGVGQPSIDRFIEGLYKRKKGKGARR